MGNEDSNTKQVLIGMQIKSVNKCWQENKRNNDRKVHARKYNYKRFEQFAERQGTCLSLSIKQAVEIQRPKLSSWPVHHLLIYNFFLLQIQKYWCKYKNIDANLKKKLPFAKSHCQLSRQSRFRDPSYLLDPFLISSDLKVCYTNIEILVHIHKYKC